jgi:hypothetical protein
MLNVIQRFGEHFSRHLQGECVLVGCFWKPYIEQAVRGEWDVTKQIGGVGERASCLLYTRLPKTPNQYTFTLKMATVMFAETLDNLQHSTRLVPENISHTLYF